MTSSSSSRTKVFISYSHKDARYLERLRVHLADYERNKLVETWDDTKITPGATWRDEIEKAIDSAKVAVLLVSADFLASDFVAESELPRLLTAAQRGGTIILPVILSPCAFEYTKLSQFQAVNSLSIPLTKMNRHQREVLWAKVAKVIRDAKIAHKSESLASNYQQSLPDLQTLTERALRTGTGTVLRSSEVDIQGSLPATTHQRVLETLFPGYFIFLLDQSVSMSNPFGVAQTGFGKRKCDIAATVLNDFLNELIVTNIVANSDGTSEVKPRAEVTVLGYSDGEVHPLLSGALANKVFVTLPELQWNPCDIELRRRKDIDETGMEIEIQVPFPIWVRPKAGGNAPMCAALQRARELAEQWAVNHPNNYPPIVINISGGLTSDGDPTQPALRLCQVSTTDGQTLLYNVQISDLNLSPILYPSSDAELPNDQFTRQLFSLSSIIPENSRSLLETLIGRPVASGARGFIFNGNLGSFRLMFKFFDIDSIGVERVKLDDAMLLSRIRLRVPDPDLKQGEVETFRLQTVAGTMQRPWGIEGGFAVVYKFRTQSGKMRALRFFKVPMPPDIQFRYEQIGAYFAAHIPHITVAFKFYENGIVLKEIVQGRMQGRIYPLIEMEWIEGVTLIEYVDELCQKRDRAGLADLHKKWIALVQAMRQAKIAHGNLSAIDIMVRTDGSLVLVDYDGVYIPAFAGLPQLVLGQVDYQHPQLHKRKFNEQMDNFSILVIQTALLALQIQPELWDQYTDRNTQGKLMDTNLLFTQQDFLTPNQSNLMVTLERINDTRIRAAVQALKQACRQHIDQVRFQLIQ